MRFIVKFIMNEKSFLSLHEKLKKIVEEKGIKQSYLCEHTGMTADAISRILNSNRKVTAEEFLGICQVLDVDPRQFFKQSA